MSDRPPEEAPPPRRLAFAALALALAMAGVLYATTRPAASGPATPLPWDMSEHYLRSLRIATNILEGSPAELLGQLREWSVYPPLNYLLRGIWFALLGESGVLLSVFHFFTLAGAVLGLWLGFRGSDPRWGISGFLVATAVLLASTDFVGHVHTVMLDAHAAALAVLALGTMPWLAADPSWRRGLITATLVAATLLTKYNIGLPLLPAMGAVWLVTIRRQRRRSLWILAAGAAAAAAWAAFLTVQHHGWESFREFSVNRATEGEWNLLTRAGFYAKTYATEKTLHPGFALVAFVLAILGLFRWRSPLCLAAGVYVLSTFLAISHHEYLLPRLLLAPAAVFSILTGAGVLVLSNRLVGHGTRRLLPAAVCILTGLIAIGPTRERVAHILPDDRARLQPVTRTVERSLEERKPDLVLGTFNDFSQPWVRLLWHRRAPTFPSPPLHVELHYPFEPARRGLDPRPDDRYRQILDEFLAREPVKVILTLEPLPGSPWWDADYALWNQWKRNYVEAARLHPGLKIDDDRVFEDAGVRVSQLSVLPAVVHEEGWGEAESWGRWILAPSARLRIDAEPSATRLVITAASHPSQRSPQPCEVLVDGVSCGTFVVDTAPWDWRDYVVGLPAAADGPRRDVEIRCAGAWPAGPQDDRLVRTPVKRVFVH